MSLFVASDVLCLCVMCVLQWIGVRNANEQAATSKGYLAVDSGIRVGLPFSVCVRVSVCVCVSVCASACLFVRLRVSVCVCGQLCVSLCVSVRAPEHSGRQIPSSWALCETDTEHLSTLRDGYRAAEHSGRQIPSS